MLSQKNEMTINTWEIKIQPKKKCVTLNWDLLLHFRKLRGTYFLFRLLLFFRCFYFCIAHPARKVKHRCVRSNRKRFYKTDFKGQFANTTVEYKFCIFYSDSMTFYIIRFICIKKRKQPVTKLMNAGYI